MLKIWSWLGVGLAAWVLCLSCGCGTKSESKGKGGTTAAPGAAGSAQGGLPSGRAVPEAGPPQVVIETSMGNVTVELNNKSAPITVDNFLRYVQGGFYDNTIFHKVGKGYVILGGAYGPDLVAKKVNSPIRNEARNGKKNVRAAMAMAREAGVIDSATSQFFINVVDNPGLDYREPTGGELKPEDYGYCVFGQVIAGMEVVEAIAGVPVEDKDDFESKPAQNVVIRSIRRIR